VSGRLSAPPALPSGAHWIGGGEGRRAGLHDMEKWKFLTLPGLELRPAVVRPEGSRYNGLRHRGSGFKLEERLSPGIQVLLDTTGARIAAKTEDPTFSRQSAHRWR
jgi:hypothetical protein